MTSPKRRAATVLLVDDHPLIRKGLRTLLESEADLAVVGEAADGEEALEHARIFSPDVVVMDITMPNLNGIEATRRILASVPDTRVIALSIHAERRFVDDMLKAGAAAYVLKDSVPEELVQAIHAVLRGEAFLSAPILGALVAGYREAVDETATAQIGEGRLADVITVLHTKLYRPAPPLDMVPRIRLLERLETGRMRPLALISAPAGYGKSILVGNWLEHCEWPGAWLSLDEDDGDLRQFLVYLVAAIRSLFPQACEASLSLVNAPGLPSISTITATLCNELDAIEQPFILVLDDYHRINARSAVNDLLHQLLSRPPIPLHLVILSRRDPPLPLVALRAEGQMTEIRMQDLRFSMTEARSLLEKTLGFTVSEEVLVNLEQEVEGWAVGLRLVSLASRRMDNPEGFLKGLHGGVQQTQEYLVQEVINRQPPGLHSWLLKTAILDRFCGPLCNAVCAEEGAADASDIDGSGFIRAILDDNLFAIPLDTRGEWYRYHHLFQAMLQRELSSSLTASGIAGLHSRASAWFECRGLIDEALDHALATGDVDLAAQIIERNRQGALNEDQWYVIEKWLTLLPESIVQQRAELLMARAWLLYHQFRFKTLLSILDHVDSLPGDSADQGPRQGEISFMRGYIAYLLGDGAGSLKHLEKALANVPVSFHEVRGQCEMFFALALQMEGRKEQALRGLYELLEHYDSASDLRKTRLLATCVYIHLICGDLVEADLSNQRLRLVAERSRYAYAEAWVAYLQGLIHLYRNELDAAVEFLGRSVRQRFIHHRKAALDSIAGLMAAHQALGHTAEAQATLQLLREFADSLNDPVYSSFADSAEARLAILQARPESAIHWLVHTAPPPDEVMLIWFEIPLLTRCRVLIIEGSSASLDEAQQCLRECAQMNEAHHNNCQLVGILALQAVAYKQQARVEDALAALERALALAGPGGFIFPFLELGQPMAELLGRLADRNGRTNFLLRLLDEFQSTRQVQPASAAAGKSQSAAADWSEEPLTNRELDILELVAKRLQNKEIANHLFVSPETVKTHLKHLYQKLGVSNRRDAADKAVDILRTVRPAGHTDTQ